MYGGWYVKLYVYVPDTRGRLWAVKKKPEEEERNNNSSSSSSVWCV